MSAQASAAMEARLEHHKKDTAITDVETAKLVTEFAKQLTLEAATHATSSKPSRQAEVLQRLEKAEHWLDKLGSTPDHHDTILHRKLGMYNVYVRLYSQQGDWDAALRFSTRILSLEKELNANAVAQAMTCLSICALYSRLSKHPVAVRYASKAIESITNYVMVEGVRARTPRKRSTSPAAAARGGGGGDAKESRHRVGATISSENPYGALAAAYYNLAMESMHCAKHEEAQRALRTGLEHAKKALPEHHPLTSQIMAAISSQHQTNRKEVTSLRVTGGDRSEAVPTRDARGKKKKADTDEAMPQLRTPADLPVIPVTLAAATPTATPATSTLTPPQPRPQRAGDKKLKPNNFLQAQRTPVARSVTPSVRKDLHAHNYTAWLGSVTASIDDHLQKRVAAAVTVQRVWRGSLARLEAYNRRQILYYFLHHAQRAAVRCLLSNYRTHKQKQSLATRKVEDAAAARARGAMEARLDAAAVLVQRNYRAFKKRQHLRRQHEAKAAKDRAEKASRYEAAAVSIQRWWPWAVERRAYWARRRVEVEEEKLRTSEFHIRTRAAGSIIRVWRGHCDRKWVKWFRKHEAEQKRKLRASLHRSADIVRVFLLETVRRRQRLAEEAVLEERKRSDAAHAVAQGWKRVLQRRAMKVMTRDVSHARAASRVIQRAYRQYRARRDLRVLRRVANTSNSHRIMQEWKAERAAVKVQCMVRCRAARKQVRALRSNFGRTIIFATWLSQRLGRGFVARRHAAALRHEAAAAVKAAAARQAAATERVLLAVTRELMARQSAQYVGDMRDAVAKEELLIIRRMRQERYEDAAAARIQATARRSQAAKQAKARQAALQDEQARIHEASTVAQAVARAWLSSANVCDRVHTVVRRYDARVHEAHLITTVIRHSIRELDVVEAGERRNWAEQEAVEREHIKKRSVE